MKVDDEGNFGIGVWSKLPVKQCELEGFGWGLPQIDMTLEVPDLAAGEPRLVRFFGLHPLPPATARGFAHRQRVFEEVIARSTQQPSLPLVVAGDLNDTRYAASFQHFCRAASLFDAAHGSSIWRTWPADPVRGGFGIRIDHILISREWGVRAVRLGPDFGSDHFPVLADLDLLSHQAR